jgi:hypothetical protein
MRILVNTGPTLRLLGLAFCRSDPLKEVDSSPTCFEQGFFLLLFATSKSQDFVERVRIPVLERTGDNAQAVLLKNWKADI